MQFDEVKTKVKEHPVEIVLVVTGLSVLGYLYHQRKQEKKRQHELEMARLEAMAPTRRVRRRLRRAHRKHRREFAQ